MATASAATSIEGHGHPDGHRVVLNARFGNYDWVEKHHKTQLKPTFLSAVAEMAAHSTPDDRLLIILNGHGGDLGAGGVAVGVSSRTLLSDTQGPRIVRPTDVLDLLRPGYFYGEATIVVNSCHSELWKDAAMVLGLGEGSGHGVSIVVGCRSDQSIYAFPRSGSRKHRGGYFINHLSGHLLQAFGRHLPRPARLQDSPVLGFEPHNIAPSTPDFSARIIEQHISIHDMMEKIADEERKLCIAGPSVPTALHQEEMDALTLVGFTAGRPLHIQLHHTLPPNPSTDFDPTPTGSCKSAYLCIQFLHGMQTNQR